MKFRSVFIVFNLLLVLFLLLMVFLPVLILGSDTVSVFWRGNWFFILVMTLLLGGFDVYFIANRRLYSLLEKEDWPALVHFLEETVIEKGKYKPHLVKLLANTYFLLSDTDSIINLENKTTIAKDSIIDDNVLVFGTARILSKDLPGALSFFELRTKSAKPAFLPWLRWYNAFTLLLSKKYAVSADEFIYITQNSSDGIIAGLSAYFLEMSLSKNISSRSQSIKDTAAEGAERVKKILFGYKDWIRESEKLKTEIHAAVLAKHIEEAGIWIYNR